MTGVQTCALPIFNETELNEMLIQNYNLYKKLFLNDVDYEFIIGWISSVEHLLHELTTLLISDVVHIIEKFI